MIFDLKRPCANCPFRKGQGEKYQLSPKRLKEIERAEGFLCHKTVDYSKPGARGRKNSRQCAGFMSVMQHEWGGSPMMQLAQRMMGVDFKDLDPQHEAYDSWADVKKAHARPNERE